MSMDYHSIILSILKFILLFMFGTITGWIIEVFWRKFAGKARRWINPGFLNGPWLPLYGFGTVVLYLICTLNLEIYYLIPLFLMVLTILEYIAGVIFIKYFKIQLWDYTKNRGNIQGIICPFYSLLWGILGSMFYFFIFPILQRNILILVNNLELSFFVGIYAGIFTMDLWSSFNLASRIKKFVTDSEEKWSVDYEKLKLELRDRITTGLKNRTHFLLPFHGEHGHGLRERLAEHKLDLPNPMKIIKKKLGDKEKKERQK